MQHRLWKAIVCVAATTVVTACGGGGDSSGGSTPISPSPTPAPSAVTITIVRQSGAQSFSPNPASFGGQQVQFRNADTVVHRVLLNDGSVDTGNIAPGATSRIVTMPGSGTNYHCSIHPDMVGAVNPAAGGPPPPCDGIYCQQQ